MRVCTGCKEAKPLEAFAINRATKSGLTSRCRACMATYSLEYRARNRPQVLAYKREHNAANPHFKWEHGYRRRAAQYGYTPRIERFTRADVVEAYGDRCHLCGGPFEHLDHWPTPVALGGAHTLANVRPSCAGCNLSRAATVKGSTRTGTTPAKMLGHADIGRTITVAVRGAPVTARLLSIGISADEVTLGLAGTPALSVALNPDQLIELET